MKGYLQNRVMLALIAIGWLLTARPNAQCVFAQEEVGVGDAQSDSTAVTDDQQIDIVQVEELDAPSRAPLSDEFQDPSFARYVDLRLVGEAIDSRDAALLADVALQLAEGERILLRNHKSGLTAKKLMGKAAKLAADSQDKASLERLTKAAQASKDDQLIAEIKAGQKLAGASRSTDPALSVSLETTNIHTLSNVMGWIDAVRDAELLGDKEQLQSLHEDIGQAAGLSDSQRAAIAKQIDQATSGAAKPDEQDAVLVKLAGESRGGLFGGGGGGGGIHIGDIGDILGGHGGGPIFGGGGGGIIPQLGVVPIFKGRFPLYGAFNLAVDDKLDLKTGTYIHQVKDSALKIGYGPCNSISVLTEVDWSEF